MSKSQQLSFVKVAGAGNHFVLVDARKGEVAPGKNWSQLTQRLCDRYKGIGADGVLLLEPSKRADVRMRILNADGSEAEMCGNGARCVLRYINAVNPQQSTIVMETKAGVLRGKVGAKTVLVEMPKPVGLNPNVSVSVDGKVFKGGFVNTGVPHFVVPVSSLPPYDVQRYGRALRYDKAFAPKGTNVNFIAPHERIQSRVCVRTYERGVEAETMACGTGVTASAIISVLLHNKAALKATAFKKKFAVSTQPTSGDVIKVGFTVVASKGEVDIQAVTMEGGAEVLFKGEVIF